ncbi:MAG: class I SAM-dependent methyltransferase [Ferruginibacter sp.]
MPAYPKRYLGEILTNSSYYLRIYNACLSIITKKTGEPAEKLSLVDFGCGNGLLGIFAMQCGFKELIFIDTEKEFCDAVPVLAGALGFELKKDQIVCGGLKDIPSPLKIANAITGTDVIEHIYSLPAFFEELATYNASIVSVFTTASNCSNPLIVSRLKKMQLQDERQGLAELNAQSKALHPSYFQMRKNIIRAAFPGLNETTVESLAQKTRGMIEADIIESVELYINKGIEPVPLSHPTNTCDPYTGSWTENLVTIREYEKLYAENNFKLEVKTGFYNQWGKAVLKNILAWKMNIGIKILGKTLAPFIILAGEAKE